MANEKKHKRPKYSLEFNQDASNLVLEKGYSQQQAADHLGISLSALGRWVKWTPLSRQIITQFKIEPCSYSS